MPAIEKLKIKGFKAFPNEFELKLDGKHLLLYGENGSGKSSIYYALHCLFQSPFKQDGGKKYFDKQNPQNLINITSNENESLIKLFFMPPHPYIYQVDKYGYNTELYGGGKPIPGNLYNNVFINHKFISNISSCRNSEDIDLYPVFYKDIFPYILTRNGKHILGDVYTKIINNPSRRKEYKTAIDNLNQETKYCIGNMNLNISDIYNDAFRNEGDMRLKIQLIFKDTPEIINGEPIYYWGRYDYRTYKEVVANQLILRRTTYKTFIEPYIGLKIEEVQPDDSVRLIDKPQTYFNEAKLTAIALSIRFSVLDLMSDANGRFLALDDFLISLDMSNRARAVDYILKISNKYKVYMFTHDLSLFRYVANRIKRDNHHEEWKYMRLYYDVKKRSPISIDEDWSYILKAERYFDICDYETTAIYLRKALEECISNLLPSELIKTADGSFLSLATLWKKLKTFYSNHKKSISTEYQRIFDDSKLLILNPAAHYPRVATPIYKYELEQVFKLYHYIDALEPLEKKMVIKSGSQIVFKHPAIDYRLQFTINSDFVISTNDGIVVKMPRCKDIKWTYKGTNFFDFGTMNQNLEHPLRKSTPKFHKLLKGTLDIESLHLTKEILLRHCMVDGTPLSEYMGILDIFSISDDV